MKHNLLTAANGLQNPIERSQRKSTTSSIHSTLLTSLFALFLLMAGSSAVWAWNVRGEGLPGLNTCTDCGNWDSNIVDMVSIGDNTYCATFLNVATESGNRYRLKICDGWKGADKLDNSKSNVNFVDAGDNRISFTIPFSSNVFVFYNSSSDKIWVIAVPVNASNYSGSSDIRQDLGLNANGWMKYSNGGVRFTSSSAYAKRVAAFVIPKGMQWRYEIYTGDTKKVDKTTVASSSSTTRLAFVVWDGSSSSASVTLMPYVIKKSGWKLFIDDVEQGTVDANGDFTVSNMSAASHTFYFTNGEGTTYHGINYFGGCYVNTSVSSSLFSNHQYYKTSAVGTFEVPTIDTKGSDSNSSYYMFPKGKFTLTGGAKDVTFNFDGGVITINAVDHGSTPEPPTPSGVTFDGSEIFYFHKKGGSLNWGSIWADDCALYLLFSNADESSTARSTKIGYFWDSEGTGGDVLATRVPAGTWTKVRVLRNNNGNRDQTWNNSDWVTLEEGKDYLNGSNAMAVYTPRTFHFYISGSTTLADTGSDFNAWNGNGTAHSGSMTKTLNAGTYKFKLNPTGTVDWRSEFNMDDLDAANSSNNINLRDGNNKEIWFDLANRSQVTIACDGSKVTVVATPVQQYTVTFNTDGGSTIDPVQVTDGGPVAQPADPTKDGYNFVKWQLSGADYNFSGPVTGNITLTAVWAYKAIESVSLNESAHTTWVGNSDFVLTLTKNPSDLITKTVAWSSDAEGVAAVSNGTVTAVSAGSATITCTVTDMNDNVRSATCEVTVAACEMATDNIYTMTVTGYNSFTGSSATLTGLWNSNEPATITKCKVRVGDIGGSQKYAVDNNGLLEAQDTGDDWLLIPAGKNGSDQQLYYIKNNSTNRYITFGERKNTGNWELYQTITTLSIDNEHITDYQFYEGQCGESRIVSMHGNCSGNYDINASTDFFLHRHNWNLNEWNLASPYVAVGKSDGCQSGNAYLRSAFTEKSSVPNPAYLASQMNTSYYRMNTNATVQANLTAALESGAAITVRLYADANTTVKLQKTDGTEITTINLSEDAELEYTYTVASNSALVGENAFVIKAVDNHAGIASIVVTRTYAASPSDPALAWDTNLSGGVTQSVSGGTFQHEASSTLSSGAVHYSSSDETVATVAADGTVTPHVAGSTTITATIEANGCYAEAYITYNVTLSESTLAELINATDPNGTLTLTSNYNEDAVINKPITIDAQGHSIGNLTVEQTGDLTLSSALTVNDFTICAKAGNTSNPAASGQVRYANNLTVNGNAYFLYTVDPSGTVHYGWYDFTVPFPVNAASGIKGIDGSGLKENFANGVDYAIMEYLGEKQGQGQYPYKKFSGVMQPNKLYSITLDSRDNYNTLRMQKTTDGALVASNTVTLNAYAGDETHANWNGVGNGTLHHANAGVSGNYIQVYQSGDKTFLPVSTSDYSFVVGTAFMVQQSGSMTLSQATHSQLLAPKRYADVPATAIQIASEGQPFSDQLFISASETGGQAYTPGIDVAKAGNIGNVNVPQIWTNAYDTKLCVHEAQLINGEAQYNLSLYAPAAGTYTLTSLNIPADYTLYLTQNGTMLTELSETYTLDLSNGITTEYGLLLIESYKMPTGLEDVQNDNVQCTKVLRNGVLYILHNGKVYNAQGGLME